MKTSIYLDYAAATPLSANALKAMQPYLTSKFHNPSATYLEGRSVRHALEEARSKIAMVLGAKPAEIIFTAGATEANNLAIQGLMKQHPDGEVLVSAIEHESALAPAKLFAHKIVPVDHQGVVNVSSLKKLISDKTVLVSVMLVNNETGALQPVKEIAAYLRQIRKLRSERNIKKPIYLHSDAAQAPCYQDIHISRLGVDLITLNGGKIYGPKQSGILYIKAGLRLEALILGGGQERGIRSGTENVAGCIGLAEALSEASNLKNTETKRVGELKKAFLEGLEEISSARVNGSLMHSTPHIISVTFDRIDNEWLMMHLDEAGVQAAVGSACSASNREPSHVLAAMGVSEAQMRSSLRFSFGRQTRPEDIRTTLKLLRRLNSSNR